MIEWIVGFGVAFASAAVGFVVGSTTNARQRDMDIRWRALKLENEAYRLLREKRLEAALNTIEEMRRTTWPDYNPPKRGD